MATAATRTRAPATRARKTTRASGPVVVIYVAQSLDGTAFALDPASQALVKRAFPDVRVSTRRVFISHDTHEACNKTIGAFENQVAILLTGLTPEQLAGTRTLRATSTTSRRAQRTSNARSDSA
jgi:hypothetical protein